MVIGVCEMNKIETVKVFDKTLPENTEILSQNIINYTGIMVPVLIKSKKQLEAEAGKKLILVDTIEVPQTNVYLSNM